MIALNRQLAAITANRTLIAVSPASLTTRGNIRPPPAEIRKKRFVLIYTESLTADQNTSADFLSGLF